MVVLATLKRTGATRGLERGTWLHRAMGSNISSAGPKLPDRLKACVAQVASAMCGVHDNLCWQWRCGAVSTLQGFLEQAMEPTRSSNPGAAVYAFQSLREDFACHSSCGKNVSSALGELFLGANGCSEGRRSRR
eukprot:782022-Amphidinium_carterae.2